MNWFLVILFAFAAAVCALLCYLAPRAKKGKLTAVTTAAQGFAAVITGIGIIFAGSLYVYEKQWSPRFAVAISADTQGNSQNQAGKPTAILQTIVSITNQSRTSQIVGGYEIGVVGLRVMSTSQPDQFGDLPSEVIQDFISKRFKIIGPGETDLAYAEAVVPCDWQLIRLIVKVPQPPFTIETPPEKRTLYQRKLLVSTRQACASAASEGPPPDQSL
jgi:hypothetical protein